jgi:hypothetical protein
MSGRCPEALVRVVNRVLVRLAVLVVLDQALRIAGADRVDEDEIGLVEQAVRILLDRYGAGAVASGLDVTTRTGPYEPMCSQMLADPGRRCRGT